MPRSCMTASWAGAFVLSAGLIAAAAVGAVGVPPQTAGSLDHLTAPSATLPAGCALALPDPEPESTGSVQPRLFGPRVETNPWFPANPWSGTDRALAAAVRVSVDWTPSPRPDGQPIDAAAARVQQLRWADNVADAYRAVYDTPDGSTVRVLAVRYDDATFVRSEPVSRLLNGRRGVSSRHALGATVVVVGAETASECFRAIEAHVQAAGDRLRATSR